MEESQILNRLVLTDDDGRIAYDVIFGTVTSERAETVAQDVAARLDPLGRFDTRIEEIGGVTYHPVGGA